MITIRTPINEEVVEFIHKASTYSDENGKHPECDSLISPEDILDGKWVINAENEEAHKKIHGQVYMFKIHKEPILILE